MKKISLGLLGRNISHSKSPEMYKRIYKNDIDYHFYDYEEELDIPQLDEIFSLVNGLSITAPYKKHFLNDVKVKPDIEPLEAINCISKVNDQFFGTNTDYLAVKEIFGSNKFLEKEIVLLGDGAMAHITKCFLKKMNKEYLQYSRKKDGDLSELSFGNKNILIINSCSRNFNFKGDIPLDLIFWDYNYSHTFHQSELTPRCSYIDGEDLLYRQAVHASHFWDLK